MKTGMCQQILVIFSNIRFNDSAIESKVNVIFYHSFCEHLVKNIKASYLSSNLGISSLRGYGNPGNKEQRNTQYHSCTPKFMLLENKCHQPAHASI